MIVTSPNSLIGHDFTITGCVYYDCGQPVKTTKKTSRSIMILRFNESYCDKADPVCNEISISRVKVYLVN